MLCTVQAVGPKLALGVLSAAPPRELVGAIAAGDTARVQSAPGVGKRTAERIVSELREKVGVDAQPGPALAPSPGDGDDPRLLARDGLLELGFSPGEAQQLLADIEGASAEELIADALRAARAG